MGQMSFWDGENRQKKLNNKKPLLSQLNELVPWEEFRPILEQIHDRERSSNAGRKPLDVTAQSAVTEYSLIEISHCEWNEVE